MVGIAAPGRRTGLQVRLGPGLLGELLWFVGHGQVEPDRGAGRVPEISPLGGQVLDQEQAVSFGRVQVALHDGRARRTVVDDLDEDAARYADHDDRDGSAFDAGFGMRDGVGNYF